MLSPATGHLVLYVLLENSYKVHEEKLLWIGCGLHSRTLGTYEMTVGQYRQNFKIFPAMKTLCSVQRSIVNHKS